MKKIMINLCAFALVLSSVLIPVYAKDNNYTYSDNPFEIKIKFLIARNFLLLHICSHKIKIEGPKKTAYLFQK